MSPQVSVYTDRQTVMKVSLGRDVSGSTFASQIRKDRRKTSDLLATWVISFETDGTDGELIFTLDVESASTIDVAEGYMDIKETKAGQPFSVSDDPMLVVFKTSVTV